MSDVETSEDGAAEAGELVTDTGETISVEDAIKNDKTITEESDELTQGDADEEDESVPSWVPDKFIDKETGKPDFEKMANSYDELQKKLVEKNKVAPEQYELSEDLADLNVEHQDYKDLVEFAKDANIGNETFNELLKFAQDSGFLYITDPEQEMAELGEDGEAMIKKLGTFAKKNFNESEIETLQSMALTADQVRVLDKIVGMAQASIPAKPGKVDVQEKQDLEGELQKLMSEPDIRTNMAKKKKAEELASQLASM